MVECSAAEQKALDLLDSILGEPAEDGEMTTADYMNDGARKFSDFMLKNAANVDMTRLQNEKNNTNAFICIGKILHDVECSKVEREALDDMESACKHEFTPEAHVVMAAASATGGMDDMMGRLDDAMANMQYAMDGSTIFAERMQNVSLDAMMRAQNIPQKDLEDAMRCMGK